MNLWWSWNHDAQRLFASLDPPLWEATQPQPDQDAAPARARATRRAVERSPASPTHLARVEAQLDEYLDDENVVRRARSSEARATPLVAYFCAEFAVHESLPQYSGGLGVLAGDHVKSASDLGLPFVGVGLLYRNGFYTQEFNADGSTRVIYPQLDFADCPITDTRQDRSTVPMGARDDQGEDLAAARRPRVALPARHRHPAEQARPTARSRATSTAATASTASARKSCSASAA